MQRKIGNKTNKLAAVIFKQQFQHNQQQQQLYYLRFVFAISDLHKFDFYVDW